MKVWEPKLLEPSGPHRAYYGTAFPLLFVLVAGPVQLAVPASLAEISHVFVVVAHGFLMRPSNPKRSQ
jgi:hypothetical protein